MPKTREELEAAWWAAWWAEDYSWAGLASKPIAGDGGPNGEKTLQDYWRRDPATGEVRDDAAMLAAGELVDAGLAGGPPGRWHIAHVPFGWSDGTPAKLLWDAPRRAALAVVVAARIEAATAARLYHAAEAGRSNRCEGRARLDGAVLLDLPAHPAGPAMPLHLVASWAHLPAWRAVGQRVGPDADFLAAFFAGDVTFGLSVFTGDVHFGAASFAGAARFDRTLFFGAADFTRAYFKGPVEYWSRRFAGDARFNTATFESDATFGYMVFSSTASFDNATFEKLVRFVGSRFDGERINQPLSSKAKILRGLTFHLAVFEAPAIFEKTNFAADPALHAEAFRGTRFKDLADFTRCGTRWIAALDEASIEGRLLIDDPGERNALAEFDTVVLPAAIAAGDRVVQALEGGARTIKVAMGRARDEAMEQRHYRFQLIARRHQAGTPRFEKAASWLYATVADYGLSLTRPLAAIAVMVVLFAALYLGFAWLAADRIPTWDGAGDALAMSLSRVFPFGAFDDISKTWIAGVLKVPTIAGHPRVLESGWSLAVRTLATVESLGAAILVFLFGLAVRRRFQIG